MERSNYYDAHNMKKTKNVPVPIGLEIFLTIWTLAGPMSLVFAAPTQSALLYVIQGHPLFVRSSSTCATFSAFDNFVDTAS